MAGLSNNDLIEEVSKTEEGDWSETSMQLTVALKKQHDIVIWCIKQVQCICADSYKQLGIQ